MLASQCPSDDIAEADSAARRWVDGRYRPIILRLLRISVLVGATWFTATLFDAITWFYFLATGRTIAKAIFIIRLILVRCVPHFSPYQMLSPLSLSLTSIVCCSIIGLMDAIILGGLFECRSAESSEGPDTGDRDGVGTSSSEGLPMVPLQTLEEGMAVGGSGSSGSSLPLPTPSLASGVEGLSSLNGSAVSTEGGGGSEFSKTPRPVTAGGDRYGNACIFVSSWNMGGVGAAEVEESLGGAGGALKDWLPRSGYDAYVRTAVVGAGEGAGEGTSPRLHVVGWEADACWMALCLVCR